MISRHLTTTEHQTIPIRPVGEASTLTAGEADLLIFLGELRPGFCERRHDSIRLAQYCGVVSLGERMLEVLPKVDEHAPPDECRGLLIRLLREAGQIPLFRDLPTGHHLKQAPLLEVFISFFFDAVAEIVRGGLLRQYREHEQDLQVVRGRILMDRQLAEHANRPDRIACRYDDLTADNLWNRLIKNGLRAVRPWLGSIDLYRRWTELSAVFEEVADVNVGARTFDRLIFDRQAVRYRTAIEWVRWILALLSPSLRAGDNLAPGLLFDMNKVFESAVTKSLSRHVSPDPRIRIDAQDSTHRLAELRGSDGRRAFLLKPDLVIRKDGAVIAIADAKWKRLKLASSGFLLPSREDIYQAHAYAGAYGCRQLSLIYPWHAELAAAKETLLELPAAGDVVPVVKIVCIDVGEDALPPMGVPASSLFQALVPEGSPRPAAI